MAEMKLAPTPEVFAKYYFAAGGVPEAAISPAPAVPPKAADAIVLTASTSAAVSVPGFASTSAADERLADQMGVLIGKVAHTTDQLAASVSTGGGEMATSLESLVGEAMPGNAVELLQSVVAIATSMHETVLASHAELIEARASLASIRAELTENRKLLEKDPLTGSENRRAMTFILQREIARAQRDGEPMSVVMIDIDHFKKINDTHGHAAGDAALVHLTQIARSVLRGNDAFVRYGGEEFLLVLAETGKSGAIFVAQRLQQALAKLPFVHLNHVITMTFSAGVSDLIDDDSEAALLRRADMALYEAKRNGRNRIVASE